ncbi:MAG: cytochrome c biogenesis protein CcdA [Betaproteobacteria bacterium]|nr:cytochrome c biogenesis protein CcdA [Betaproteobacteria bacterium]
MSAILLSLLAGMLTVINPCVLPVLPIVLLGALQQHRLGPLALAGGMVAGFTALGLLVYGAGTAFELSSDTVRQTGAVLLLMLGIVMLSGPLKNQLAAVGSRWTGSLNALLDHAAPGGLAGQFVTGAVLGAIWSPCSGPTLGSAVTLATQSGALPRAAAIMLFFGIGATLPMLALAYGSRRTLVARRDLLARLGRVAMPLMGALLIAIALLALSGFDKRIEALLLNAMPEWWVNLTTRF